MWSSYDPVLVREELAVLAANGCNVTRSFCYWPDFVPEPEHLDPEVLGHFADFLDAHVDLGLGTIPTFIVGHMSGENWDPAWRGGRDLYRDVWMVSQQAWFAQELASRFSRHPAIEGWLISNEMPHYGGPAPESVVTAWGRLMVQALRAGGVTQPVSIGDGAWGVEVSGRDNGYSLRTLAPLVDWLGPHVYPMSNDPVRQALDAAFVCAMCASFGKPVVLEEFGVSSDFVSDDHAAEYYRQVLYSSLLAGARGWLAWNNCDYDDLQNQDPYRHHPFEMHFGLTDRNGKPKAQLDEIVRFAAFVARLSGQPWEPVSGDAVIVVPEHFERRLPFTNEAYGVDMRAILLQSFIASREADLPVSIVRETGGLPSGPSLFLLPSTQLLTAPGTARLAQLAEEGATVYASYFAGSTDNLHGPWVPWLNDIFGFRQQLRNGLVDRIDNDDVVLEFLQDFGGIEAGTRLRVGIGGNEHSRAFLPVTPNEAEVVAVDDHGRPALLRRRCGKGWTVFCTYPLEYLAASRAGVNPEITGDIYSALADMAGVDRPVTSPDRRVLVGRIRTGDNPASDAATELVVVANASDASFTAELRTDATSRLLEQGQDAGAEAVESVLLNPWDVKILVRHFKNPLAGTTAEWAIRNPGAGVRASGPR
jgi:endo-1,4-beta-mannosidase